MILLTNQCKISVLYKVLFLVVILFGSTMCKCKIDDTKTRIECSGRLWKNELLPSKSTTITELKIRNAYPSSSDSKYPKRRIKLKLNFLKDFSNIKSITITNSHLTNLPVISFNVSTVEKLDLSYNKLDIWGSELFGGYQTVIRGAINLKTLDLSHNKLTTLPITWLHCPSKLQNLNLDYNAVTGLDIRLSNCLVNLQFLSLRGNYFRLGTEATDPILPPGSRQGSSSQLHPQQNKPANSILDSSRRFVKKRCTRETMSSLERQHNYSSQLPSFGKVKSLDLSDNCIQHFGFKLPFMRFRSLTTLLLAHNLLSTPSYSRSLPLSASSLSSDMNLVSSSSSSSSSSGDSDTFVQQCDFGTAAFYIGNNRGIQHIDLSSNPGILMFQKGCLFGNDHLNTLNLSNCSIIYIEKDSFKNKMALVDLDLSDNQLKQVPVELGRLANVLSRLSLANNRLTTNDSLVLMQMSSLKYLNMSGNRYRTISVSSRMPQVKHFLPNLLTTSDKPLSLLHNMHQLQMLDLSVNNITEISLNSDFSRVQRIKLKYLDLSGNTGLETVQYLSHNNVPPFASLATLRLPTISCCFKCDCAALYFMDWLATRPEKITLACQFPSKLRDALISSLIIRQDLHDKCFKLTDDPNKLPNIPNNNGNRDRQQQQQQPSDPRKSPDSFSMVIQSNANRTQSSSNQNSEFQSPSSHHQSDGVFGGQNWILLHGALILVCQSSMKTPGTKIEWRRQKVINSVVEPLVSLRESGQRQVAPGGFAPQHQSNFAWNGDLSLRTRQSVKTELLGSFVDPRIKVESYGPIPVERSFNFNKLLDPTAIRSYPDNGNGFDRNLVSQLEAAVVSQNTKNNYEAGQLKQVSILQLSNVQFSDAAQYYCLTTTITSSSSGSSDDSSSNYRLDAPLLSNKINISVFSPPRFTVTPGRQISAIEGESVEIPCSAKAYPPPVTALGLAGTRSFPAAASKRLVVYKDDASFFITHAHLEDAGNYTCTSHNPAGSISLHFSLHIQVPATILASSQDSPYGPKQHPADQSGERPLSVTLGHPLVLRFRVAGKPVPKVKWTKDAVELTPHDGGRVRFSADKLMLVVEKAQLADAGLYKISVLNGFGTNHASVRVSVLSPGESPPSSSSSSSSSNNSGLISAPAWLGDYWLSGIVIVVLLSILLTSALWVVVFVCCTRRCIRPAYHHTNHHHHQNWLRFCFCDYSPESLPPDGNPGSKPDHTPSQPPDGKPSAITPLSLWHNNHHHHQIISNGSNHHLTISDNNNTAAAAHQLLSELLLTNSYHSDHTTTTTSFNDIVGNGGISSSSHISNNSNYKKSSGKKKGSGSKLKSSQSIPLSITQHHAPSSSHFRTPRYHFTTNFNAPPPPNNSSNLYIAPPLPLPPQSTTNHHHHHQSSISYSDISLMLPPRHGPSANSEDPHHDDMSSHVPHAAAATPSSLRFIASPSSSPSIYHPHHHHYPYPPSSVARLKSGGMIGPSNTSSSGGAVTSMYDSGVESGSTLYTTTTVPATTTDSLHSVEPPYAMS